MSAVASARVSSRASARVVRRSTALPSRPARAVLPSQRKASRLVVRAEADKPTTSTLSGQEEFDKVIKDLQVKWDEVENKTSVVVYTGAAIVTLWLANTVVGAINTVPVLPKLLELVGLGYTAWFVYRYLLFKSSREELLQDIEELKKKIAGNE